MKSGEDKNARGEEKIKELEDLGMRGVIFFPTTHSSFLLCLPQPTADRKTFDGGYLYKVQIVGYCFIRDN